MALTSSSPGGTNMIRNILTGVITTVAGATAVYFLGFHKKGESKTADYLVVKEATTKAWKSYVALENLEYKNSMLLLQNIQNIDNFKEELTKESNKFSADVNALLKDEEVDPTFISLLKRRLDAEGEAMKKWNVFFDNAETIVRTTPQGQQQTQKINNELTKMQTGGKLILDRFKIEITELAKSLTEKYGYTFASNELLMLHQQDQNTANNNNNNNNTQNNNGGVNVTELNNQNNNSNNNNYNNQGTHNNNNDNYDYGNATSFSAKNFVGEWQTQAGYMYLDQNGGMSWDWSNGQITDGTWKFYNNQIYQYPTQYYGAGSVWVFNVSNVTRNSFTMQLVNSNVIYYVTRVNDGY